MESIFGENKMSPSQGVYSELISTKSNIRKKHDNKIAAVAAHLIQVIDLTSDEEDVVDLTSDEKDVVDLTGDEKDLVDLCDEKNPIDLTSDDESIINLNSDAEERPQENNFVKQSHRGSDYYLCEFCGKIYLKAGDILHHCDIHRQKKKKMKSIFDD